MAAKPVMRASWFGRRLRWMKTARGIQKPTKARRSTNAFSEVRKYKLGIIDELLNYDIDGLFLDWIRTGDIRDNPQTDEKGIANSGYEQPNVEAFKKQYGADPHDLPNDDERWVKLRAQP